MRQCKYIYERKANIKYFSDNFNTIFQFQNWILEIQIAYIICMYDT